MKTTIEMRLTLEVERVSEDGMPFLSFGDIMIRPRLDDPKKPLFKTVFLDPQAHQFEILHGASDGTLEELLIRNFGPYLNEKITLHEQELEAEKGEEIK